MPNSIPNSTIPVLHEALQGQEENSEMGNPNVVCDDLEVQDVRAVKGGALSAETFMLPRPEVCLHTLTL